MGEWARKVYFGEFRKLFILSPYFKGSLALCYFYSI